MAGRIAMETYRRCHEMLAEGADNGLIALELDVSVSWVAREAARWLKGLPPSQVPRAEQRAQAKAAAPKAKAGKVQTFTEAQLASEVKKAKAADRIPSAGQNGRTHTVQAIEREAGQFDFPKRPDELSADARRALEDIEFFARRYYGYVFLPWQVLAAKKIKELLESPQEEYVVINVSPGAGKTVTFGRVITEWLTARDRAMRGMIGSATNSVATKIVDQMRRDFTRASPDLISQTDRNRGLVQADATLAQDFGRFRPDVAGHLWTRTEFEVAQIDDRMVNQKEPTWSAFGVDTTFIGWRVDFALWDDLWDMRKVRTSEARESFFHWYDNTAESRLEPGGCFCLMGQRLAVQDVYAYALEKKIDLDGWEQTGDPETFQPRYHHIVFKAFDESKLTGDVQLDKFLMSPDGPAWPEGPLLSPKRLPWTRLRAIKSDNPSLFALTYQQTSEGVTERLVDPVWVSGGMGLDGEYHPGCRDDDRGWWEKPEGLAGPLVSVAMTDPSGTARWGHLWYLWQPGVAGEREDTRHLMAAKHRKMPADQFLDWNSSTGTWSGLMEEWWQRSSDLGAPIQWWIVEQNAAQRYLLQYDHVRRWQLARGVRIIGHNTHRNKHDPDLGLTATIPPVWRRGLIRIPFREAQSQGIERDMTAVDFIKVHQDYPHVSADDLVMAGWFFEVNKDQIRPVMGDMPRQARPRWAASLSRSGRGNERRARFG